MAVVITELDMSPNEIYNIIHGLSDTPQSRESLVSALRILRAQEPSRRANFNREFYWNYGEKAADRFIELVQDPLIGEQILGYIDWWTVRRLAFTCTALYKLHKHDLRRIPLVYWYLPKVKIELEISEAKQRWQAFQGEISRIEQQLANLPKPKEKRAKKKQSLSARDWKDQKRAWQAQRK